MIIKNTNMPVSGCLPGLLFARWVMPLWSSVAWKSLFLCSNFSWWKTKENINGKFIQQKIQEGPLPNTQRLSSEYEYQPRPPNINSVKRTKGMSETRFWERNPCYKWPFYSWGIMFAQRQLGAFEKMWDTVSQHIHLWPSHCLSHWGCNPSCNTSHFCLCFCRLRQSPGHGCSKIHLFIQKEGMNCG